MAETYREVDPANMGARIVVQVNSSRGFRMPTKYSVPLDVPWTSFRDQLELDAYILREWDYRELGAPFWVRHECRGPAAGGHLLPARILALRGATAPCSETVLVDVDPDAAPPRVSTPDCFDDCFESSIAESSIAGSIAPEAMHPRHTHPQAGPLVTSAFAVPPMIPFRRGTLLKAHGGPRHEVYIDCGLFRYCLLVPDAITVHEFFVLLVMQGIMVDNYEDETPLVVGGARRRVDATQLFWYFESDTPAHRVVRVIGASCPRSVFAVRADRHAYDNALRSYGAASDT